MRNYLLVSAAYWGFTLSDGALRMLVLLHFYKLGYSPFSLAFLFLLYEAAGIIANLIGGWLATRHGISRMLAVGLGAQMLGFIMLARLDPAWTATASLLWVVLAQGISGIAKDLTKTASKAAIKLTQAAAAAHDNANLSGQLFKWVAWFTGSKNAMKGVGFFLGGLLLESIGFVNALLAMAALLGLILLGVLLSLPGRLGQRKASSSPRELLAKSPGVNRLAMARIGLFAARDVWFVVGVPVYLYSFGWSFTEVGTFLALWTIAYGTVQGAAPSLVGRSTDGLSREVPAARSWSLSLFFIACSLTALAVVGAVGQPWWVVAGLGLFGVVFAVNSSVHSYLVLAYAGSEKAAEDVGFYYAANALGRFFGTLLSGLLFQWGGLILVLAGSSTFLLVCWIATLRLPLTASEASPTAIRASGY
jgi:MFS family permease